MRRIGKTQWVEFERWVEDDDRRGDLVFVNMASVSQVGPNGNQANDGLYVDDFRLVVRGTLEELASLLDDEAYHG